MEKAGILNFLKKQGGRSFLMRELVKQLAPTAAERPQVRRLIKAMVEEGQIQRIGRSRYGLAGADKERRPAPLTKARDLIRGRLQVNPSGYGFVLPEAEGESDLYIPAKAMAEAMDGDLVLAKVWRRKAEGKREGRIVEILERGQTKIIGTYYEEGSIAYVSPQDPRLPQDIVITKKDGLAPRRGQMVQVEILRYPTRINPAQGRIIEILGWPDDPRIEFSIIIKKYELAEDFPPAVQGAAQSLPRGIGPQDINGRRDLRSGITFTIDGETAKDFDDAVSLEILPSGNFLLGVHIADVSHYVLPGSPLDQEAYARGTSVYFPGWCIPMLPEALSNGICSLNPQVDRLTQTALMEFDRQGTLRNYQLFPSVIHSRARLTYTVVKEIIVDEDPQALELWPQVVPHLMKMKELCLILRQRRLERGSLDFDLPEAEVILSLTGKPTDVIKVERNLAHQLIEEFMIAANETVARHLTALEWPFIYRIHEPPDPVKLRDIADYLRQLGLQVKISEPVTPANLQGILQQAERRPEKHLISNLVLRSLMLAKYSPLNQGHFGLASSCYTHFTSPIRRYPDLLVHRLLRESWQGQLKANRRDYWEGFLPPAAKDSSERERRAEEAERELVDWLKILFMKDKVGEVYEGLVSGVAPFGFWVELAEHFVEGLVHINTLSDDQYQYEEKGHRLVGKRRKKSFRIGDKVTVQVARVDLARRKMDLVLV
jgi:ribonuclease R